MRVFLVLGFAAALAGLPAYAETPASPAGAAVAAGEAPVDPRAVDALKRMSTFLQTLNSYRLTSTSSLDVVTVENQKVQLDAVSRYQVKRPGIMIDWGSDQKSRQFFYDGKQFTLSAPLLG